MMNRYRKILVFIITLLFMIVLIIAGWHRSYYDIKCTSYLCEDNERLVSVRLVAIGDLHNYEFDENNQELIFKLQDQQPDAILMIGDMINSDSTDLDSILKLVTEVTSIAPVYYALGNHELSWMESHNEDLVLQLETAGAIVLNREYCDVEVNGQQIRIGGLYDYAFSLQDLDMTDEEDERVQVRKFLEDFQDTDAFKIMLAHRPDSFIFGDASKVWDIDLVASGHLHGGQVVLPFFGGVYGGDQGNFPEYVHGLYEKDNMHIAITSGLSTNKKAIPRWNNPPEIMLIELTTLK